ncbi:hypothetical protein AKUA2001_06770 [Apilactobacillus kunkeei]|nr:hypothetical protein AKUA2001_06770 [Apilactobacillus kunkeei]
MWASLTLIMLFIYIAVTIIGITRVSVKRVIQWLIASRVIYINTDYANRYHHSSFGSSFLHRNIC